MLSCLCDDEYKLTLAANRKEWPVKWRQRISSIVSLWSFTICLTPYNRKFKNVLSASLNKTFLSLSPSIYGALAGGGGGGGGPTEPHTNRTTHYG